MKSKRSSGMRWDRSVRWAAGILLAGIALAACLVGLRGRVPDGPEGARPQYYPIDPIRITYSERGAGGAGPSGAPDRVPVSWLTGILRQKQVRPEDFDRTLEHVIALYSSLQQQLGSADAAHPEIASFVAGAGGALEERDFSKAERLLDRAYEKQAEAVERLVADVEKRRFAAAQTAVKIGDLHRMQLEYDQAVQAYRKAADWIPSEKGPQMAEILAKWGKAAFEAGDHEEAERILRKRLALAEADADGNEGAPPRYEALDDLAATLQQSGRYAEAESTYREALRAAEASEGVAHQRWRQIRIRLAFVLQAQGRFAEAERLCRQALAADEGTVGEDHPETAAHLNVLAAVVQVQGRLSEAEDLYRRAARIYGDVFGDGHPAHAVVLNNLAGVVGMQGRMKEAESLYRRVLEIDAATVGKDHPNYVKHLNNLAALLQAGGRLDEAEVLYRRAITIGEAVFPPGAPQRVTLEKNLAAVMEKNESLPSPPPEPPAANPPLRSRP